jgi:hypothetical protein
MERHGDSKTGFHSLTEAINTTAPAAGIQGLIQEGASGRSGLNENNH